MSKYKKLFIILSIINILSCTPVPEFDFDKVHQFETAYLLNKIPHDEFVRRSNYIVEKYGNYHSLYDDLVSGQESINALFDDPVVKNELGGILLNRCISYRYVDGTELGKKIIDLGVNPFIRDYLDLMPIINSVVTDNVILYQYILGHADTQSYIQDNGTDFLDLIQNYAQYRQSNDKK